MYRGEAGREYAKHIMDKISNGSPLCPFGAMSLDPSFIEENLTPEQRAPSMANLNQE